jgi:hypothetical protein
MKAIVDALNIIYDEDEKRGLIWLNVVSLFFTICAIAGAGLAIALVVVSPFAVAVAPSRHQGDHNVSIRYQRSSNVHCDWFSGRIILNERHLGRVLSSYFQYHHDARRISRSTRTAHGLVAYTFPPRATLLPSRSSAVCIHRYERRAAWDWRGCTLRLSPPNCPQFIFEQGLDHGRARRRGYLAH